MTIHSNIVNVLSMLKRNNQHAVLCYRNNSKLQYKNNKIYYANVEVPWQTTWYFDGKLGNFNADTHFSAYNESYVVIIDEQPDLRTNDQWKTLNTVITSSAWCSLEICLSKGVYLVTENSWNHHSPSELYLLNGTYVVYKLMYEATTYWAKSKQDKKAREELTYKVKDVVRRSNNPRFDDMREICNAIEKYA